MDVQEILKWADEVVLAKTGSHLNNLQQAILAGVWNSQKYREIADEYHCTEANVKRVAGNLWSLVSEELGEPVTKSNFRAAIERHQISNSSNIGNVVKSNFVSNSINLCGEHCPYPPGAKTRSPTTTPTTTGNQPEQRHDFTEAPDLERLDNRTAELTTLKRWIREEKIRLVTLFGLPGIGKTALARELVEQIKDNFEYIVWRNCTGTLALQSLETYLIQFFSQNRETKLPSLIDYIRSHPCLIILDDLQELFTPGELAGTYLPNCENYGKFWQQIARSPHTSCILLLSWEKPTEIATLEGENRHCRTLQLRGLGEPAAEILAKKGLADEDKWSELIQLYAGNPSWLNIIASTILDLFNGSVERFLSYPSFFLGDLEPRLQAYYQRLSESEKKVILWLAHQEAADILRKPAELALSDADFLKAVQSLRKRGLIEKVSENGFPLFAVLTVFKAYLKETFAGSSDIAVAT